jgi:cysteine synthase A
MIKIDNTVKDEKILEQAVKRYRERNIILPTFEQQKNPELVPAKIKEQLKNIGLWDLHPLNLFRITWKNEPVEFGGEYGKVNYLEIPSELSGVKARIVMLIGKFFPTGSHKVGAAYGCLAPRLVKGEFDPYTQKAVWPSTGNYCRGGAFDSYLMGCTAVAILPERMSQERFDWLKEIGAEVIATPGCESNVKEIYDKCWEIRKTRPDCVIFNQFDEFGNACWHYYITGSAIEEVFNEVKKAGSRLSAYISATGSAGTIAAGDYLRTKFPFIKVVASEALQCPTLLLNGFGDHRIEGIGDKHVPWIHNVKNTNMVVAINDENPMRILRVFNEPDGHALLKARGIPEEVIKKLPLLGISSISNLLSAIKTAKYYEMTEDDIIFTVATDSADLYKSRVQELREELGTYSLKQAEIDWERYMLGYDIDNMKELSYRDQKQIHNLKYYTWIEQQFKDLDDLNQLWSDAHIWEQIFAQVPEWDKLINQFNDKVGLL